MPPFLSSIILPVLPAEPLSAETIGSDPRGDVTVSGGNIVVELPEPPSPAAFWRFNGSQGIAP